MRNRYWLGIFNLQMVTGLGGDNSNLRHGPQPAFPPPSNLGPVRAAERVPALDLWTHDKDSRYFLLLPGKSSLLPFALII
jgi:hypothetical protein